jgi:hypothetical protein
MLRLLGIDYDALLSRSVCGFAGAGFLRKIRRQPSAALLALLERRLTTYSLQRIDERRKLAMRALEALPYVTIPGRDNASHTYWVFPILCDEPEELRRLVAAHPDWDYEDLYADNLARLPDYFRDDLDPDLTTDISGRDLDLLDPATDPVTGRLHAPGFRPGSGIALDATRVAQLAE